MSRLTKAIADTAARRLFRTATITAVVDHGSRFRSIELTGDDLKTATFNVGDKIQIRTDPDALAPRTYTPITWDTHQGTTNLLAYTHGTGPGSAWVNSLTTGMTCQFLGPRSSLKLEGLDAPIVFVGDETSFALVAAWQTNHPESPAVAQLFEVTDPDHCSPALDGSGISSPHLFRRDPDGAHLNELTDALVDVLRSHSDAALCLTGRAQSIATIRRSLKTAGLADRPSRVKAYWDPNRTGLD